ncbi:MAG TPA: isochorismatase family protein [Hypericibacter adhaerens]|uniref:isochorismatase family protein n=1 Tax=Hypericibacter adhaerens TaxID=2602016 RepID=UPI002CD7E468|nr:isochorismatase family protein [Hypericibacter adhaerens]HWA43261.1 isochorismatase family protein [Hypericibacter adhaerens]
MRQSARIDPTRTALLLVDLQEEQRPGQPYGVAGFETVLANARKLLAAARERSLPVFHAAYRRDFDIVPPRPFEPLSTGGRSTFSDKSDPLTAICHEVAPQPGELVIHKNDASAFADGSLTRALDEARTEWLFIAGVWTEACVAASIRDAMAQGRRVILVKDACGSGTVAMHQVATLNIANRLYGGMIAETAGALALMTGEPVETWTPERPVPIFFHLSDAADHYERL